MNENIKELAIKAGFSKLTFDPSGDEAAKVDAFAELIIKECIKLNKAAIQKLKDDPEDIPGYNTFMNLSRLVCEIEIYEHFRVS